jgi:hypothetical protein
MLMSLLVREFNSTHLDRLKQKALYCDTHSVISIQTDDQPALVETGDCLGAMTSELKPGLHIEECLGRT